VDKTGPKARGSSLKANRKRLSVTKRETKKLGKEEGPGDTRGFSETFGGGESEEGG